ncbi:MurR/RpiR family transcriptional regulator [Photobacterium aphoticum]|uniref:Transcriptional regulator n=1 Tax=Photobacterium aphoticum TaxID=754436 RepID=A0A0J1GLF0_9GAMM|nr:MurR/RpiR family transcriptional regulator [Photobacterium aphoticum]KLV00446.1 transcriptional regulator [Photobacterium aphoticum]PSU59792.1 MurR/RpiR family transcriptional regulator [Photobacterium aphoticum]GHA42294.1 RpiR family transcriptional regulator [Photobacterium aphoticum]
MNKQEFINAVNKFDTHTDAETRIAQYFMQHYAVLPFAKIDELCKQIGVGKATLGRFLQRLGFSGFIDFKKEVTEDLTQTLTIPIERYEHQTNNDNPDDIHGLLISHYREVKDNVEKTFDALSEQDFERAIDIMCQPRGKLYVMGSASSEALANYFFLLARYLRKEVIFLKGDISTLPHQLVDVTKEDTLFAISYHRYSSVTVKLVRWFHECGGQIITLTDQPVNPFVPYSDVQFMVESEGKGYFNNRAAGFALIEALIKGLSLQQEKDNRFQRIEGLFEEFSIFKS